MKLADMLLQKMLPLVTRIQSTPRYSSASLGAMGACQKLIQGQLRTMKAETEAKYGSPSKPEDNIFP